MLMNAAPGHPPAQQHGTACGCGEPHDQERPASRPLRWFSTLTPVVACAFCPACLATYAKLFSLVGLGFAMTEAQHSVLLTCAVFVSVVASAWRWRRAGRWSPLAGTVLSGSMVLMGHFAGERSWLEWSGIGAMLASAWYEQRITRRLSRQAAADSAAAQLAVCEGPRRGT